MMYSRPMVENNFTEPSDSISFSPNKFKPLGPIITPEIINPIIEGIRIFRNNMGESRMMNKTNEKINTGFLKGN
jgi:hypothetical protein